MTHPASALPTCWRLKWATAHKQPALYCPVPESFTSCGLNPPVLVTVATPLTAPVVVGEKATTNVQIAPAPNEAPQGDPPPATAEKSPLAE